MNYKYFLVLATGGPLGYSIAPGTVATCSILPLIYIIAKLNMPLWLYVIFALIILCVGWYIVKCAIPFFTESDPSEIILDEMIAAIFVFIGLPNDAYIFLLGCILFRMFDIFKPLGITYVERLGGAAGIILDDLVAALYANITLHALLYFSC